MLIDRHDLPLSTASAAARAAYVEGCEAKLTMYPGALDAYHRAIEADPGFALAHAARAQALSERGETGAARAAMATAASLTDGLAAWEKSHVAYFGLLVAGDSEAALSALPPHLNAWPRDVMVLATAAFTNGLIGSSGRADQKRRLLALLDGLAPVYGDDDWWFTAHHGMALSENGDRAAARPIIERAFGQNPKNPWAAHARAHLCYEEGDADTARAFLASWLSGYPRDGTLYSHLNWHRALGELEAGDAETASRLFREAIVPEVHSNPPRGALNDGVAFLWRWELAGHPRNADAWRTVYELVAGNFPRAGAAFTDLHVAVAEAVAGNDAALAARTAQAEELARQGRYPSGPLIPAVSRGFVAFERGDYAAAIAAFEPVATELQRVGGSRAQLDLIEFTLLKAYLAAGRVDDARRMVGARGRGSSRLPVAGLAALH